MRNERNARQLLLNKSFAQNDMKEKCLYDLAIKQIKMKKKSNQKETQHETSETKEITAELEF